MIPKTIGMTDITIHRGNTQSLCPICLERIQADFVQEADILYMDKTCDTHGKFRSKVWKGSTENWDKPKHPIGHRFHMTQSLKGCPFDCGLCPEHRQQTCTAVLDITSSCNMNCAFCFADSSPGRQIKDPSMEALIQRLTRVQENSPGCNLQISGGEPTLREDLPAIISGAQKIGFEFIQLNTNGLMLAQNPNFAKTLRSSGLSSVFLQFDATHDEIHKKIRRQALTRIKQQAIEHCIGANIGVVLVPTLVPGINTDQIGPILEFALGQAPGVRGVHFQPVSYFGRYPMNKKSPIAGPNDRDRLTIPEILIQIEDQTQGVFKKRAFTPPSCEHSFCSFSGKFIINETGRPVPLAPSAKTCCTPIQAEQGAARAKASVVKQWAAPQPTPCPPKDKNQTFEPDGLDQFLARAATHLFSVSGMAFQDIWNLDIERLKGCCIHSVAPDGRLIPFCAYNLTSATGKGLYR